MELIKVKDIAVDPESIRSAIRSLDEAIEVHMKMKEHFEQVLALQSEQARVSSRGGRGSGRRSRDRKTLRQAIVEVLASAGAPLKPVDLRNRVMESGYQTRMGPQSFYTAVFNTAKAEPSVVKTAAGFRLRAGAGGGKAGKRAAARKRPVPRRRPGRPAKKGRKKRRAAKRS